MRSSDPFSACRPRLLGIAYATVGEVGEAEEVVQDAWLRWQGAERDEVANAEAFLVAVVTRLAIDRVRSARARREAYVGTWLPDPLVADLDDPESLSIEAEEVSLALLVALERLDPVERAVLVLRDVFDTEYAAIADAVDVSPANARQIATRARARVGDESRRRSVDADEQRRLTVAFLRAARDGDVEALRALLAADAIQYSDGGGRTVAARTPVRGAEKIARFYATTRRNGSMPLDLQATPVLVNGEIGVRLDVPAGKLFAITALEIADGQVLAIRNFMNPERFGGLGRGRGGSTGAGAERR